MQKYQGSTLQKEWDAKRQVLKKKIREMSVPQLCKSFLRVLLQAVTVVYIVCMLVALPLYYRRETGYSFIGSNKSDFFMDKGFFLGRTFIHIFLFYAAFALLCFFLENRGEKGKFSLLLNALLEELSLTDKFAILYTIGVLLSYYYTDYRAELRLGAQGWYMGLWPQLLLVGSYFAVSRLLPKCAVKWMTLALLVTSGFVFLVGLLNRYNVNPLGISPRMRRELAEKIDVVASYPDPEYTELRKHIAAYTRCLAEQVIVGNGCTELISLFIQVLKPREALIVSPTYSEYEREVRLSGGTVRYYALKEQNGFHSP